MSFNKEASKCYNCYTVGSEARLKICSRCRAAKYCSRQCQSAHWQAHKVICYKNAAHAAALKSANSLNHIPLPDGMTLTELDQRLEKWIHFHTPILMTACMHALSVPKDITLARTHVMRVLLTPRTDHGGSASKYFRVRAATMQSIAEAMGFGAPWPSSLEDLAKMREESESKERGTVTAAAIECPPLGVQMVPFGSLTRGSLFGMQILPNWEDILKRGVETGTKFTKFRS